MNHYFPIFIDLNNRKCIVYGGGTIAARRVSGLLRFGARVTVYDPVPGDGVRELLITYSETLALCEQPYRPGIPEADFVFSCTNDQQVDAAIYKECRARGIPVNIASDQSLCDFYFPALVEQKDMVIGICSGGKNHGKVKALAARLREWIEGL